MDKILTLICFCFSTLLFSQTNEEVASVYIKRAKMSFNEEDTNNAIKSYTKALKYMDLDTNPDVDLSKFGMILFAKASHYSKAQELGKTYFNSVSDKATDEYLNMLELYVDIIDKIEEGSENSQGKKY